MSTSSSPRSLVWTSDWLEVQGFLPQLVELDSRFFPTPWTKEQWESLLGQGQRDFSLGLFHEGPKLLAFALFFHDKLDAFSHLVKVVVNPTVRNHGLASELIGQMQESFPERIYLEVEESNLPALRLYLKLGFQSLRPLKDFYGPGRHGRGMLWIRA